MNATAAEPAQSVDDPAPPPERMSPLAVGVVVWLASEVMFFGGLFTGYAVYRSPVTRGGYERVGTASGTTYSDSDAQLRSGQAYYYVVRALDAPGNESADSNEARVVPAYAIGWANLQWPPTLDYTVSASQTTDTVYGQVWIDGVTSKPGPTPGLRAELGYGAQAQPNIPANSTLYFVVDIVSAK